MGWGAGGVNPLKDRGSLSGKFRESKEKKDSTDCCMWSPKLKASRTFYVPKLKRRKKQEQPPQCQPTVHPNKEQRVLNSVSATAGRCALPSVPCNCALVSGWGELLGRGSPSEFQTLSNIPPCTVYCLPPSTQGLTSRQENALMTSRLSGCLPFGLNSPVLWPRAGITPNAAEVRLHRAPLSASLVQ